MPNRNDKLNSAKKNKKDEFYTRYEDIEKELSHYPNAFEGKTVYCNCDDPTKSNFVKYFKEHFDKLGLKRLIATCFNGDAGKGETMFLFPRTDDRVAWHFEKTADGETCTPLQYNGDFVSEECIRLLEQCDIVVTNPPFSLFGKFFSTLIENGVDFIVLGHLTSTTRKNVFPYLISSKVYIDGINHLAEFIGSEKRIAIGWYSTLKSDRKREPLNLTATYTPEHYPRFDNYDAIEVSKIAEIPCDYDGVMGVPITFLNNYCPEQFEIVGIAHRGAGDPALKSKVYTKEDYPNYSEMNKSPVLQDENGNLYNIYPRILIRRRPDSSTEHPHNAT